MVELLDTSTCGWTACSEIDWMNVPFPEDVKDVLVNDLEGVDDIYGYDEESDLEDCVLYFVLSYLVIELI